MNESLSKLQKIFYNIIVGYGAFLTDDNGNVVLKITTNVGIYSNVKYALRGYFTEVRPNMTFMVKEVQNLTNEKYTGFVPGDEIKFGELSNMPINDVTIDKDYISLMLPLYYINNLLASVSKEEAKAKEESSFNLDSLFEFDHLSINQIKVLCNIFITVNDVLARHKTQTDECLREIYNFYEGIVKIPSNIPVLQEVIKISENKELKKHYTVGDFVARLKFKYNIK